MLTYLSTGFRNLENILGSKLKVLLLNWPIPTPIIALKYLVNKMFLKILNIKDTPISFKLFSLL